MGTLSEAQGKGLNQRPAAKGELGANRAISAPAFCRLLTSLLSPSLVMLRHRLPQYGRGSGL